jgi:hypothetical protein
MSWPVWGGHSCPPAFDLDFDLEFGSSRSEVAQPEPENQEQLQSVGQSLPSAKSKGVSDPHFLAVSIGLAVAFYPFGGSHNSIRLPSGSMIQAKRPYS